MTDHAEWRVDWCNIALFAVGCAIMFGLFALLHRDSEKAQWPLVQGTIQDTRIVADHGLETKWGSELTWRADYVVAYSVAGREYKARADSGVRGESEAVVKLALPQPRPPCRVRYNPKKPEASIADCR